uniref:Uncharacterized protein n=1 Tax=Ornithorhynchus anatinus TaxID=9258 RepID=K7E8B0_ORNAN
VPRQLLPPPASSEPFTPEPADPLPSQRPRRLWSVLRRGLRLVLEKMRRAERRVSHLTQGLELVRRLEVASGLRAAAQDAAGGRLVLLDAGGRRLLVHGEDGWARGSAPTPVQLSGLAALPLPPRGPCHFVGWGQEGLALLGPDLHLLALSTLPVARALRCGVPVPGSGLLVAGGPAGLTIWEFRTGGRRLALRRHLEPTPSSSSASGRLPGPMTRLALKLPAPPGSLPLCFATCGAALATFDLEKGLRLDVRRELHKTDISDVAYCQAACAVVTASRDNTVKVWEAQWQLRNVFVGHVGPVTALAVLPSTPRVLSASRDGTLRTWDLDTGEQVGEVALQAGAEGARPEVTGLLPPARPGAPVVALGPAWAELWRLRELYVPLAALPAPVLALQAAPPLCTALRAALPQRLLCLCRDWSVRLLAAPSGRPLAALQLDGPAAAAYCLVRETLLVLTGGGGLLRVNAAVSPMQVVQRVPPPPAPAPRPCCLHLYHHLPDPVAAQTSWTNVRLRGRELRRRSHKPLNYQDKNRFLPVLGYEDGSLSVLDWLSARPLFHTAAHGPGPVSILVSCTQTLLSTGADLTVKMWRVYPYAEESLSLLRSFTCRHPAVGLCLLGTQLTVAFESPGSATYGLVQYGLRDGVRRDHRPQDDPTDHITGLCCCPPLRLYACSSLDRTIRIWSAQNQLLRILYLDTAAQALTFCNDKGDLVLALGSRLCLLPHTVYLPTAYLIKVPVARAGRGQRGEREIPDPTSSFPTGDPASLRACAHLAARNQDLQLLALGRVSPATSQAPLTRQLQEEAFHRYLALLYGSALRIPVRGGREEGFSPRDLCPPLSKCMKSFSSSAAWPLRTPTPGQGGIQGPGFRLCLDHTGLLGTPSRPFPSCPSLWLPKATDLTDQSGGSRGPGPHSGLRVGPEPSLHSESPPTVGRRRAGPGRTLLGTDLDSLSGLAKLLLRVLPGVTWAEAGDVLQALLFLLPHLSPDQRQQLQNQLFRLLNQETPSLQEENEKRFVLLALRVLMELGDGSKEVVLQLMAYFLCSSITQRAILWALLGELGLRDPHGFLPLEMERWVQAEAKASKARLRAICEHHLNGMIQELKVPAPAPSSSLDPSLSLGGTQLPPTLRPPPQQDFLNGIR